MRTVVAVLVCGLELFLWALFSQAMGWKRLGGVLPMVILFSIVSVTWKAIRSPAESPDAEPDEEPQSPDSLDSVAVEAAEPVVLEPIADESGSFEAIVCDGCTWLVAADSITMRNGRSLCPSCVSALTAARSAQPAAALREMAPARTSALVDPHSRPVESSGPAVPVRTLESDTSRRRLSVWRLPMWLYCIFALATWYRSGWESESQALERVLFGCLVAISVTIPASLVFGAIGRSQAVASWSFVVLLLGVFAFQEADHRGLMDEWSAQVPGTGGGESAPSADSDLAASPDDQDGLYGDMPGSSPIDEPDLVRPTPPRVRLRPLDSESSRPDPPPWSAPGLGTAARTTVSTGGVNIEIPLPPGYLDVTSTAVELLETTRRLSPPGNRVLAVLVPREATRQPGWPSVPIEEIKHPVSIHVVRSLEYELISAPMFDRIMQEFQKKPPGLPPSQRALLKLRFAEEGRQEGVQISCLFEETKSQVRRAGRRGAVVTMVYPVSITDPSTPLEAPVKVWQGGTTIAVQTRQRVLYFSFPLEQAEDRDRAEQVARWFVTRMTGWQPDSSAQMLVPPFSTSGPSVASSAPADLKPTNWSTIDVEQFGTIRIPPQLEIQHGQQVEVLKQLNKRIGKSNPQESRLVVQPRGMSRFEPQALKWYFRLIIESEPQKKADKLDLNELRQAGPLALAAVGQQLKSEISQVMGKSLLEMSPVQMKTIDRRPALYWWIRRRSTVATRPPVVVHNYWVSSDVRMHRIQVAWRVTETDRWGKLLGDLVAGMRIVDSPLKPVPPGTGAGDSENLEDYKRRALRIVESMTSTDRSKLPKRDRAFLKFHEGLTAEAVSATTKDSNLSDRLDERALRLYGEAIEIDPSLAEAYVARGCILLNNHSEHARAIADHTKAIQLKPDYAKAYYHRADTYRDKGDSENTLSDLNQAIRLDPNFGAAYYMRAGCYKSRMRLDLYRSDLRKAQELKYESTSYPKFLAP